ncbi:hypothetical protein D3C71_1509440 [compost metagenome]
MLRAHGDDDFLCVGPDAPARQDLGADLLDQGGVVMGDEVGRPTADVQHRQRLDAALAPFRRGKQVGVELPVDEGVGLLLPVLRLADIALARRAKAQPFVPADLLRLFSRGHDRRRFVGRPRMPLHDGIADEMAAAFA